jgi:hypothetical protein
MCVCGGQKTEKGRREAAYMGYRHVAEDRKSKNNGWEAKKGKPSVGTHEL